MTNLTGIRIVFDEEGNPVEAIIDLKKHGNVFSPVLKEMGAFEQPDFKEKFKQGLTAKELKHEVHKHIDSLPWKTGK